MLGIDLTKISRFKDVKNTFVSKVLHPDEIKEYELAADKAYFMAGRWAIKEALYKADNNFFHFNKIRIEKENGVYKFPGYVITTTTEGDYYHAMVQRRNNENKN